MLPWRLMRYNHTPKPEGVIGLELEGISLAQKRTEASN